MGPTGSSPSSPEFKRFALVALEYGDNDGYLMELEQEI